MKIYYNIKIFKIVVILIFFAFILSNKVSASEVIFQENFDSPEQQNTFPNNWIYIDEPYKPRCNAQWLIQNGMIKIDIKNQFNCTSNIMPNNLLWSELKDNYIYELDAYFIKGTDHNIIYRIDPLSIFSIYELHFLSPHDFDLIVPIGSTYITNIPRNYSFLDKHHIKIIVKNNNIKVLVDNELVRDVKTGSNLPKGKIALRAGTGGDPNSETWFDNIKISSIDSEDLAVPYYSQNSDPWGPQEYDHSESLGFSNSTMDRWGCAVTSAAMVLNYHKINQFSDGIQIDPGTLNKWLSENNGYLTGYNKKHESYSYINWNAISSLSYGLYKENYAPTKLEMDIRNVSPNTTTKVGNTDMKGNELLDQDLLTNKLPDILSVSNNKTSSHFIVAKGKSSDSYSINDPEWKYPNLLSFNNTYSKIIRYIPTESDLSYIVLVINPEVEISIKDVNNKKSGKLIINGITSTYNEVSNAQYITENSINNSDESLGIDPNVLYLQKPINGKYEVTVSSLQNELYTLNILTFNKNGYINIFKPKNVISPNNNRIYEINFDKDNQSNISEKITFTTIFDDINTLWNIQFINIEPHKEHLIKILTQALTYYADKNYKMTDQRLRQFDNMLSEHRGESLTEDAYQILHNDITKLKDYLVKV